MANISRFVEIKLRLKVNAAKSAVAQPWQRKFLGLASPDPIRRVRCVGSRLKRLHVFGSECAK
jgi:RNA-directed DNA polymerase